jgi:hypothetical protein
MSSLPADDSPISIPLLGFSLGSIPVRINRIKIDDKVEEAKSICILVKLVFISLAAGAELKFIIHFKC